MKTTIYLSQNSSQLRKLQIDSYFPEAELHPREVIKSIPELIGKSFCTHSEVIVNQFGHMIGDKLIDSKNVEIRLMTEDGDIKVFNYDDEGYIIDWQIGFFEPLNLSANPS